MQVADLNYEKHRYVELFTSNEHEFLLHLTGEGQELLHCWGGADALYIYITFTFSHLADAFVQSDVQGREQSS